MVKYTPVGPFVYLCGPITGLTFKEGADWRTHAGDRLKEVGITALSPLRCKEFLDAEGVLLDSYEQYPLASEKGLTTRDRFDVLRSDVVLANFVGAKAISAGSMIEFGWADLSDTPIVAVMGDDDLHNLHPMVRALAGYVVRSLDEGLAIVEAMLASTY